MGDASQIGASESEEEITFEVCSHPVQFQDPQDSEDEAEHTDVAKIRNTKAVDCFSACLEWLQHAAA